MTVIERIDQDLKEAMKAKNATRLQSIRLIWNAVRKKEIDDRKDLDDQGVQKLMQTMQKQVRESLEQAEAAGRGDLADEAKAELLIYAEFLPEPLSQADLEKAVQSIKEKLSSEGKLPEGPKAMGLLMKESMAELAGRVEGKHLQEAVKKTLGL